MGIQYKEIIREAVSSSSPLSKMAAVSQTNLNNLNDAVFEVPEDKWPRLERRLENLKAALVGTGNSFDYVATPKSVLAGDDELTGVRHIYYEVKITCNLKSAENDWEVVGIVERQANGAGITLHTLWNKNVMIPESFYKRSGVIECDHCGYSKNGKTQRNSAVILHRCNTPDATSDSKNLWENFKLIGTGCVNKFTEIPLGLISEIVTTLDKLKEAESHEYTQEELDAIERKRFSINLKFWVAMNLVRVNNHWGDYIKTPTEIAENFNSSDRVKRETALMKFNRDYKSSKYWEDALRATDSMFEEITNKTLVQKEGFKDFEILSNMKVLVKAGAIKPKDATSELFQNIVNTFVCCDEWTIYPEEKVALALASSGTSWDTRRLQEILAAEKNKFGEVKIARSSVVVSSIDSYEEKLNNTQALKSVIEDIYMYPGSFDLALLNESTKITKEELDEIRQKAETVGDEKFRSKYQGNHKEGEVFENLLLKKIDSGYSNTIYESKDGLRFAISDADCHGWDKVLLKYGTVASTKAPSYLLMDNVEIKNANIGDAKLGDKFSNLHLKITSKNIFSARMSGKSYANLLCSDDNGRVYYLTTNNVFDVGDDIVVDAAEYQRDSFKGHHTEYIYLGMIYSNHIKKLGEKEEPNSAQFSDNVTKKIEAVKSLIDEGKVPEEFRSLLDKDGKLARRGSWGVIKNNINDPAVKKAFKELWVAMNDDGLF